MSILVTGGAGYIGSHTCISLIESGYDIVVFDNFSNASIESIKRVEKIVGTTISVVEGDIRDKEALSRVFNTFSIESVIHFAGVKAVGESVTNPLKYYDNNINGTVTLCQVMTEHNCKSIVFSSSATVYGDPHTTPIDESFPTSPNNPYGRSKLFVEELLKDLYLSDNNWQIILLRYFNPVGAHTSGTLGEDPNDIPNNLMPYITQTAIGKRPSLAIFGNDYDTHDGTGVRDYIHIMDLVQGHINALKKLMTISTPLTVNLGTGKGYSVLDMVHAFEKASGEKIPYSIAPRRSGDIAICYTNPDYAQEVLEWKATKGIDEMCEDSWRWQVNNPNGYKKEQS